jgi:hypothetical protein
VEPGAANSQTPAVDSVVQQGSLRKGPSTCLLWHGAHGIQHPVHLKCGWAQGSTGRCRATGRPQNSHVVSGQRRLRTGLPNLYTAHTLEKMRGHRRCVRAKDASANPVSTMGVNCTAVCSVAASAVEFEVMRTQPRRPTHPSPTRTHVQLPVAQRSQALLLKRAAEDEAAQPGAVTRPRLRTRDASAGAIVQQ